MRDTMLIVSPISVYLNPDACYNYHYIIIIPCVKCIDWLRRCVERASTRRVMNTWIYTTYTIHKMPDIHLQAIFSMSLVLDSQKHPSQKKITQQQEQNIT